MLNQFAGPEISISKPNTYDRQSVGFDRIHTHNIDIAWVKDSNKLLHVNVYILQPEQQVMSYSYNKKKHTG